MKKAALHNLGCKVNAYETEAMQQMLEDAGYEIVPFREQADVYVINTCTVTNIADRKSRQMLHRARKQNPDAVIVAAGCFVQLAGQEILETGMADIILGNNKKKQLISMLDAYKQEHACMAQWEDINDGQKEYEPLSLVRSSGHTRAFIKVQDGCNQFCSYCVIPYARGRVRSRPLADILAEVHALAVAGYQEVVLTGIHISSYGIDTGDSLLHLIASIHQIEAIKRIRLGSLEPGIVTEEFASALSGLGKVCPHFHLSLQSGCDSVLKRMNRKYDTQSYAKRCGILRNYFADPALTTDVIVGFPGETLEEFQETRQFAEKIHFAEMHVFKYSRRGGTKAAQMPGQVAEQDKAERSAQLISLGAQMAEAYVQGMLGQVRTALLEETIVYEGQTYAVGYTKEYVKIAVKTEKDRFNCFVKGKIVRKLLPNIYLMVEF